MSDTTISRAFVHFTTHHNSGETHESIQVLATPNKSNHICINYNMLVADVINYVMGTSISNADIAEQLSNNGHAGYRTFEDEANNREIKFKIELEDGNVFTLVRDDTHRRPGEPPNIYIGWGNADDKNHNVWIQVEEVRKWEVDRIKNLASIMLKEC
ncbi:MAG: hypothetical protein JXR12_06695 [Neptunomonas phycophila]|uniref:hypothetical protein n=1 Tax=Neptunomonas phycophila TaxID=1572645 RepID=UPI003B8CFFBB